MKLPDTPVVAGVLLIAVLTACAERTGAADGTSALAAPGTAIPAFSYPSIRGWTFDRGRLLLGHTLIALVPGEATGKEPELVEFDSLKQRNPMFRYAIVYDRGVEPRDTAYLNDPSWLMGTERGFASDSQIVATFGATEQGILDKLRRPRLRLPSFLVVSDSGRVVARVAGPPMATLGPVMDSLRAIWDSARTVEGDAEVARTRPRLALGVRSFDPATLFASAERVRLGSSCGGEETVSRGIIPATARVIDIHARHPGVTTTLEITSVAVVEPVDGDDVCRSEQAQVTPRVETHRYRMDFFDSLPDSAGTGELYTDMSLTPLDEAGGGGGRALIALTDSGGPRLRLPAGVTMQELRARVDSIRRAAQ